MNIFIFTFKNIDVGGIETTTIEIAKRCHDEGCKVILFRQLGGNIATQFSWAEEVYETVEIDPLRDKKWLSNCKIKADIKDKVIMFTANILDYAILCKIKTVNPDLNITILYWIPHFRGKIIFLENWFPKFVRKPIRSMLRRMYQIMVDHNDIYFGNSTHFEAFNNVYNLNLDHEPRFLLLEGRNKRKPLDINYLKEKEKKRNKKFTILTVSRLDFPHKGYVIGLIRDFPNIAEKFPNCELEIVGYGDGIQEVKTTINDFDDRIKDKIHLIGKISIEELADYYKNAHWFIGIAETVIEAAEYATISIPARHYTRECEGYGYLPEAKELTVCSEPGTPIIKYIQEVILMNSDEYIQKSIEAYDCYEDFHNYSEKFIEDFFGWENSANDLALPTRVIDFFILSRRLSNRFLLLKRLGTN